jgi:hypothetical protein
VTFLAGPRKLAATTSRISLPSTNVWLAQTHIKGPHLVYQKPKAAVRLRALPGRRPEIGDLGARPRAAGRLVDDVEDVLTSRRLIVFEILKRPAHISYDAHSRVMSVAALQKQLSRSEIGDVRLQVYLTDLCRSIGASMIHDVT